MQSYHLTDEFSDQAAEQAILTSLTHSPGLYWELLDLLTSEVFTTEADTWQALALALETGQTPRCSFHKSFASRWLPGSAGFQPAPEAGETPALPGKGLDDWRCIYETDI